MSNHGPASTSAMKCRIATRFSAPLNSFLRILCSARGRIPAVHLLPGHRLRAGLRDIAGVTAKLWLTSHRKKSLRPAQQFRSKIFLDRNRLAQALSEISAAGTGHAANGDAAPRSRLSATARQPKREWHKFVLRSSGAFKCGRVV